MRQHENLIDFYTATLISMGLTVTEDGYIKIKVGQDSDGSDKMVTLTTNGKPLVLPTKQHIESAVDTDEESGKLVTTKILYNPLNEDVIKGDSTALKTTRDIVETKLAHSFAGVCELLLTLASNKKLQSKTSMEINKFLSSLSTADNPGIKQIVDTKTVNLWGKLYAKTLDPATKTKLLKLYLKKSGTYKGTKYNRLSVLTLPLLADIQSADRETPVLGIDLRNKDIKVFELLYSYIFKDLDENHTMSIGTNDPESPGFIALFKTYLTIGHRINHIAKSLKDINQEIYDTTHLNLKVTLKELDNLNLFARELAVIPSELELNRQKNTAPSANQTLANAINKPTAPVVTPQQIKEQEQYQEQPQVQYEQPQAPELTTAQKILYGNNVPIVPTFDPETMAAAAQANMQAQMNPQVKPTGINNIPVQPVYGQQPVYPGVQQQPVYPGVQQQQPVYPNMQQQPVYPNMQQQPVYPGMSQSNGYQQPQVRPVGINSVRYQ